MQNFYGMPGAILSFNAICLGSFVIIMLLKINKQVEREKLGILSWIKEIKEKKVGNS